MYLHKYVHLIKYVHNIKKKARTPPICFIDFQSHGSQIK